MSDGAKRTKQSDSVSRCACARPPVCVRLRYCTVCAPTPQPALPLCGTVRCARTGTELCASTEQDKVLSLNY